MIDYQVCVCGNRHGSVCKKSVNFQKKNFIKHPRSYLLSMKIYLAIMFTENTEETKKRYTVF